MKKMRLTFTLLILACAVAFCQPDKEFTKPIKVVSITYPDGTTQTTAYLGGTGGSVDWSAILNKPATYPPSTHNHDASYKAIGYVPLWTEITGKPSTFPPSAHNHDALYKPLSYVPIWTEITGKPATYPSDWSTTANKPESIELADAILSMSGIKLPVLTTAQINVLTPVVGLLVYDSTLNVLKIYTGTWKIVITNN